MLTLLESNFPGNPHMGLGIPPLKDNIKLESNPLKSTMLIGRLGVWASRNQKVRPEPILVRYHDVSSCSILLYDVTWRSVLKLISLYLMWSPWLRTKFRQLYYKYVIVLFSTIVFRSYFKHFNIPVIVYMI